MKKQYKLLVLLVVMVILSIPGTALAKEYQDDRVVAGGTFSLESGETLDGSLIVFGGTVSIEQNATVRRDVVVLGGIATIEGDVGGNVVGVGGVINLRETSTVGGDLTTVAATLNRDPGSQVNGQVITSVDIPALSMLPSSIDIPAITRFEPSFYNPGEYTVWRVFWFIFRILLWGALAALVAMFLPKQTTRVSQTIVKEPVLSGGLGLLTIIIAPIVLLLLAITCILSPVSLLGILVLVIAWAFGRIAIGLEIGLRIAKAFNREWPLPLAAGVGTFGLALVVDGLGTFIFCVGWLIPTIVGMFGLGGVLLTRFGTQSHPKESQLAETGEADFPAELIDSPEPASLEDQASDADPADEIPDPSGEK
ncbi:MAG: hypothetical protein JSV42_12445 [Chloroflexota bacterium]|nr:MAG: hypothetical protein JSV42_12445 [Chloroflexota bacterium]